MRAGPFTSNQRGQGTVENLMLTVIIAALLVPVVYRVIIGPLMGAFQGQKETLVKFIAQDTKKKVPTAWFAAERVDQMKDPKNIQEPKQIDSKEIPEPGEVPPTKDINEPKEIKNRDMKQPKDIKEPGKISEPKAIQSGNIGPGSGGGSSGGSSVSAQDPDFFGGGDKKDKPAESGGTSGPGDGSAGRGSVSGGGDEYSPKKKIETENQKEGGAGKSSGDKKEETAVDKKAKQNLVLNEVRQEERARSSRFDWWLLLKALILGLIIFLVVLIGLSNMKKR